MSKRKLLLADDSITIQKVVNLTFADEGIDVIAVGDGDAAMEKFAEVTPDLVMADVNMPGLNGYQVCERIKQNEATKQIPVILLVGSFEPFDESEATRVGANDFLTKPFQSIRQLVNKVTELLEQGSANGTAEGAAARDEQSDELTTAPVADLAEAPEIEAGAELGDTGMDDEMIEASSADEFARREAPSYESEPLDDYARTQPLSEEDLREFEVEEAERAEAQASGEEPLAPESDYAAALGDAETAAPLVEDEPAPQPIEEIEPLAEDAAPALVDDEVEFSLDENEEPAVTAVAADERVRPGVTSPESVLFVGFDDEDLLELPPFASEAPDVEERAPEQTAPEAVGYAETPAAQTDYPPEVIEAIAQRVAEKISSQAVREIAAQIAPQISELIARELSRQRQEE